MKIICEYCKNTVDSDKYTKCTTCGADINNSEMIKNTIKMQNEKQRIELEQEKIEQIRRKKTLESMEKGEQFAKILKIGCLIPFILMIILFVISISMAIKEQLGFNNENQEDKTQAVVVQGEFNQPVNNSVISVTCDKYEEFERYSKPTQGYKYMRFHFIVENVTDEEIYDDEKIRVLVDGIQCERVSFSDVKQLPETYIMPGTKIDGYIGVEIPEDATDAEIKYGDYITIYVDMNN